MKGFRGRVAHNELESSYLDHLLEWFGQTNSEDDIPMFFNPVLAIKTFLITIFVLLAACGCYLIYDRITASMNQLEQEPPHQALPREEQENSSVIDICFLGTNNEIEVCDNESMTTTASNDSAILPMRNDLGYLNALPRRSQRLRNKRFRISQIR